MTTLDFLKSETDTELGKLRCEWFELETIKREKEQSQCAELEAQRAAAAWDAYRTVLMAEFKASLTPAELAEALRAPEAGR